MLATLNLQLLPAEITDDGMRTSASLAPNGGTGAAAGFADLLEKGVNEAVALSQTAGELLPSGGSDLPVVSLAPAGLISGELPIDLAAGLPASDPLGEAFSIPGIPTFSGSPMTTAEIDLEAVILYPPTDPEGAVAATPAAPLDPPLNAAEGPVSTTIEGSKSALSLEARPVPVVAGQLVAQSLMPAAAGRPVAAQSLTPPVAEPVVQDALPDALNGARSKPQLAAIAQAERPVANVTPAMPSADLDRAVPLVELPQRPTITASAERADAIAQELKPLLRARPTVTQPAQAMHAQLNLQPPPNLLLTPATTAAGTDLSYAAAAQQATDLIGTSVRDSIWGERVGERVIMMAGNQLRSAEIRLTPAELGPLRVQVAVEDGAANVTFHAQHAVTRDALEQALPRLREMLAENGLTLGNAQVGDDGVGRGGSENDARTPGTSAAGGDVADGAVDPDSAAGRRATVSRGLVDTFA